MTVHSKLVTNGASSSASRSKIVPPIPFEKPDKPVLGKDELQKYKLRHNPTDDKSPTYELEIQYFSDDGTCEDFLEFETKIKEIFRGQNVTTGIGRFNVVRRLFKGSALTTFNQALPQNGGTETLISFEKCLDAVRVQVFPTRAVLLQKRYMRRFLRKRAGNTTREYVARLTELNDYIERFPPLEEGGDPPRKLENDEILDLLEFGIPNSWQRQMMLHDFDPLSHTMKEFVSFCERLEMVEKHEGKNRNQTDDEGSSTEKKSNNNKRRRGGGTCRLHGENTHDTHDCKTLMAQAERMKATYEARSPEERRKLKSNKDHKKQELNFEERVMQVLTKEKKRAKKRRTEKELNHFENLSLSESSDNDNDNASSSGEDSD